MNIISRERSSWDVSTCLPETKIKTQILKKMSSICAAEKMAEDTVYTLRRCCFITILLFWHTWNLSTKANLKSWLVDVGNAQSAFPEAFPHAVTETRHTGWSGWRASALIIVSSILMSIRYLGIKHPEPLNPFAHAHLDARKQTHIWE